MTSLRELHPIYREALCVWEAFRRTGFSAAEIYVGRQPPGHFVVALPHLRYGWVVTPSGCDHLALKEAFAEDVVRDWQDAAHLWNELAARRDPELERVWEESAIRKQAVQFVSEMVRYGVELPCATDC